MSGHGDRRSFLPPAARAPPRAAEGPVTRAAARAQDPTNGQHGGADTEASLPAPPASAPAPAQTTAEADVFGTESPPREASRITGTGDILCGANGDCATRVWVTDLFAGEMQRLRAEFTSRDESARISEQLCALASNLQALAARIDRPRDLVSNVDIASVSEVDVGEVFPVPSARGPIRIRGKDWQQQGVDRPPRMPSPPQEPLPRMQTTIGEEGFYALSSSHPRSGYHQGSKPHRQGLAQTRPLQPFEAPSDHLPGIEVLNPRFKKILCLDRYRLSLNCRDSRTGSVVTRQVNQWATHLRPAMAHVLFSGYPPIKGLQWLTTFVRLLRGTSLTEGAGLHIWPHFLTEAAASEFWVNFEDPENGAHGAGFSTWPEAVHWFLTTYLREEYLQQAADELESLQQRPTEDETSFANRLRAASRVIAGAYSTNDLMGLFLRGTHEAHRGVLRFERAHCKGATAFHDFVARAQAWGTQARLANNRKPPGRAFVNSIARAESANAGNTVAVLAQRGQFHGTPSGLHPDDTDSTGTPQTFHTALDEQDWAPEPTGDPLTGDSLLAIASKPHVSGGRYVGDRRGNERNLARPRRDGPQGQPRDVRMPDICFECFQKGHRRPKCPQNARLVKDSAYEAWVCENFRRLTPAHQRYMRSLGRIPVGILLAEARAAGASRARMESSVVNPPRVKTSANETTLIDPEAPPPPPEPVPESHPSASKN